MMEGNENQDFGNRNSHHDNREEIFAKAVRAGKRTYFFDIRSTRGKDYYLTITESKRKYEDDGSYKYQKHKIFLYKEDFKKFSEALAETINEVIKLRSAQDAEEAGSIADSFADVNFEDLGPMPGDDNHSSNGAEKVDEPEPRESDGNW